MSALVLGGSVAMASNSPTWCPMLVISAIAASLRTPTIRSENCSARAGSNPGATPSGVLSGAAAELVLLLVSVLLIVSILDMVVLPAAGPERRSLGMTLGGRARECIGQIVHCGVPTCTR